MRLAWPILLVALAGCVAPAPLAPAPDAQTWGFAPPVAVSREAPGAEPVVAIAPDGTLYLQGGGVGETGVGSARVFRSDDDGATWLDVTPRILGEGPPLDFFVAVDEEGRVFVAYTYGFSTHLLRSDDRGASWRPLPFPQATLPAHRMWIVPAGASTVYLAVEAYAPNRGLWVARSDDAGETWPLVAPADLEAFFGSNLALDASRGALVAARLTFPSPLEERPPRVHVVRSEDRGASWVRAGGFELGGPLESGWLSLSVDAAGRAFLLWAEVQGGRAVARLAVSADGGATWSPARDVFPGAGTQTMPWGHPAAPGVLDVAAYVSDEAGLPPQMDAAWHVDVARLGPDGVARATRVSDGPVHQGGICNEGAGCPADERRLLDYLWLSHGPDGRAHVAFASTAWDRPQAFALHAAERARVAADANLQ